ncbi:hypothetical protein PUN28_009330 [Cardiocondyla obscurior]|uniref:Uncharacterized protein n=1 Tax=Cardiocondyla obscurior TaxID=286306 RepID=A0AAW2FRH8_9HYME
MLARIILQRIRGLSSPIISANESVQRPCRSKDNARSQEAFDRVRRRRNWSGIDASVK